MAYIGKQPVVGNFVKLDAIVTSATATYNLLNGGVAYYPQTANNCIVSLNGVIQSPTSAYTISGSTIVFSDALTSSDSIDFILVLGDVLSIGTPSDATVTNAKLALTAGSAGTPTISPAADTNTGIYFPAADTIAFTEGGTEAMRIDSSGNVGIGTSAAAEKLEVSGTEASGGVEILLTNIGDGGASTTPYVGIRARLNSIRNGGEIRFGRDNTYGDASSSDSNIKFYTALDDVNTERMRIDSSGNVGIGETTVASKLHIKSDGSVNACARMNNTEAGTGSSNTVIFQRNGTNIGFITATGTATGYVTSSDYRLKENVVYNLNGIERVKLLKPARFNFIIEPNKIVDGFLAHEVSNIVPEAIHGNKDEIDSEGNPVHQGIDQSKLVPLLTGALQEAITKIESLEARLTVLESNIS
jgi:hypothetical protein